MKLAKINQTGRSMIEMLGVLSIVGILSVGGISGFTKAMTKYKLNQAIEQYNLIFDLITEDMSKWKRIKDISAGSYYHLSKLWKQMKIIPENMVENINDENLYDQFGNKFYVRKFPTYIEWAIFMNTGKNGVFKTNGQTKEVCRALYLNAIVLRHDELKRVFLYLGGGNEASGKYNFYGDAYCDETRQCLSDITINDIMNICSECEDDKMCRIAVLWQI